MTIAHEINRLGALNLRQDPTKLQDWECVKLVNFDVCRKPGSLVVRRGTETLYNVSATDTIRQVAKVNGFRYQVANEYLHRDGTIIARDLAPERETNFQAFRPLDDTAIWAFVADDNYMLKDDGQTTGYRPTGARLYIWGLDLIPRPGPSLSNQTGKDPTDTITDGDYLCAVTQIRWDTTQSGRLLMIE